MSTDDPVKRSRQLVEQLKRSQIYQDYEQAFRDTTGLPINLRPIESFNLPHAGDPNENPFCALMAKTNHSCAACLQLQRKVEEQARLEPKTLKCFAGLCDSAVPIRVGDNLIAFLQTGQILLHKPKIHEFTKATKEIIGWGTEVDLKKLEEFRAKAFDNLALDHSGALVYLAPTRVNLQLTLERWPDIEFRETREHLAAAA